VKENLPVGSFVTKVTAVDDDSDLSLVYQIVGGYGLGRFTIDSNGNIYTAAVLDCETNSHYWLTVVAKDRAAVPLTAHLEVYISVENENDLAPITTEAFYYARVSENASIGTNVIQVEAHDPDLDSDTETKINFRLINEVPFTIDQNGLVRTKSKLDRELESRYVIDVEISEEYNADSKEPVMTTMLSRTPIVVNIIDVNEFEPKAILSIYRCQAYNDISQKIPICQIVAIDRDDDENCVLQYKFIEGNDYNWFSIDQTNGAIYTAKDGIPKGEYDYIISVSDCGTPRKSSQVRVILRILSVPKGKKDNHKPIIEAFDPEISISERESVGYAVTLIKAIDEDNDRLCYHIISGNIGNTFAFRDGGALIVAKPLSYKLTNKYNLTISVTDGISSSLVNLIVNLIDVFDNKVSFIQDSYTVNVLENITKGNEILQLSTTDREFSDGIVFSIYSTFSPETLKKFEVESWSGKIKVKESLDYESGKHHILVIEAYNSRVKTLSSHDRSFAKVSINIIDVNDETPTFILPQFEANIMETSAIGTSVLQVQAVDKDVGINAKINYSIISGNVDNVFDIDNEIGFVFLAKQLNARQQSEYYLVIKAMDKGLPPLSSTANVHISVSIPDNSPPKFDQKLYTVDVKENEKIGTVIIALKATSRQSLYFEIVSGNNENKFSINVNNGEIWLRSELDYETNRNYSLTISATSLVGINDTTKLFINVIDINDCVPYWKQDSFTGHILESAHIGSIILDKNDLPLVIKAYDDDSMHNSILIYSIIEETGRKYFNIEPRTGAITLARRIDYEKKREFNFTVTVTDHGFPSLKAATDAFVKIDCLPVNDCAPVLSLNHYHSTVLLPTYRNVIVTKISATDCDFGKHDEQHDHFIFSLTPITSSSDKKFSINSTSGLITTSDDRMTEGVYEMFVSVFDGKFTTEAKVTITAEPIPRSSLRFTQEKFFGHITENTLTVKTILMPTIEGNKLNEHLSFRILNPTNLFRIARTSGAILSRGIPIDREENSR
jgi:protocadherin Fat 1/2/3